MTFLAHNLEYFIFSNSIHSICTTRIHLHRPVTKLASYQTSVYYRSIKIFNILPKCGVDLMKDKKQFVW